MSVICPNCTILMQETSIQGHYTQTYIIDQCQKCGGIWFDQSEHYKTKTNQILELDKIDTAKLAANKPLKTNLSCPKDITRLIKYSDQNFPASIDLETCPHCHGLWFNHGEYSQFIQNRISQKNQTLNPKLEKQLDLMIKNQASPNYDFIGDFSNFLMTSYYSDSPKDIQNREKIQPAVNIATSIINALIKG